MEFKIVEREIKHLANGEVLKLKSYHLKSNEEGPTVCLQSSVHGAEVQGQPTIYYLLEYFFKNPFKGEIIITPVANPQAMNYKAGTFTQGRFNPVTGDNWNRLYVDLIPAAKARGIFDISEFAKNHAKNDLLTIKKEFKKELSKIITELKKDSKFSINENKKLTLTLQEIAINSDIMLDLHTGPVATRYLYVPEYLVEQSYDILFPHHLIIPNEFGGAMDEATFCPWIALHAELIKYGVTIKASELIETYTVELGSEETISFKEAKIDAAHILHFLSKRGVIADSEGQKFKNEVTKNRKKAEMPYRCELSNYKTIYTEAHGVCEYLVKPGDKVYGGDILARVLNFGPLKTTSDLSKTVTEIRADEEMVIVNHHNSAVVSSGIELFQVMTKLL